MRNLNRATVLALLAPLALCAAPAAAQDPALAELEGELVELIEQVSEAFVVIGGGSGIIVSPEGDILTNHHVAGGRKIGEEWQVILPGRNFQIATMIGTDSRGDISLLRLKGEGPWPYVPLTDSDAIEVGDPVVALGNPFGFSKDGTPNVTVGLISAFHRFQGGYSDAIQTDTAINPGNSGGPLLDMNGRLIGINGKIAVRWGNRANSGIGYAIPANQIEQFIPAFRKRGEVRHGTIRTLKLAHTEGGNGGARVAGIAKESAGFKSGLREGDVILEADGRPVPTPQRFQGIVGTFPVGDALKVVVERDGQRQEIEVTLEERGEVRQRNGAYLGINMSQQPNGGVEIEKVEPDSPAAKADLQTGDVVTKFTFDGKSVPVRTTRHLTRALRGRVPGDAIKLTVTRPGAGELELEIQLGEWPDVKPKPEDKPEAPKGP